MRTNFLESTYSLFCSSLVGFDFKLQFVHQVLQTQGILPIFLSLRTDRKQSCQFKNKCYK